MEMPSSPWREIIPNLSAHEVERRIAAYSSQLVNDKAQVSLDLHFGASVLAKLGFLRSAAACTVAAEFLEPEFDEVAEPLADVAPEHAPYLDMEHDVRPAASKGSAHWVVRRPTPMQPLYTAICHRVVDDRPAGGRLEGPSLTLLRGKVLDWFQRRSMPATCVPRDELDAPDILETWL